MKAKTKSYKLVVRIKKNQDQFVYKFSDSLLLPDWLKESIAIDLDKFLRDGSK